ncbi:hypothetical protein Daus18300_000493 [Diaporthe australafricana]|uniref:Uncharacterized protein n=1 Tax=Diaporthe australafricana TaxID=127596 RepID=A0ABR3Y4I2_9PEZI
MKQLNPKCSLLDSTLLDVNRLAQGEVTCKLWGGASIHLKHLNSLDVNFGPYWNFYVKECAYALHNCGRHIAIRTHADVLQVAAQLEADLTRLEIKDSIRTKLTSRHANEEEILENSINLVSSLLIMIHCGTFSYGFSGGTELRWTHGSLRQHLAYYFAEPPVLGHERIKLENNFTAPNLTRIAGLEIEWTDNLIDHLRMSDDDKKVHIFHHATFLECQRQSENSLLPDGLAAETLQTLALLLPTADSETKRWFSKTAATADLDSRAIRCGRLRSDRRQIEKFKFWRDRLVTLKQVFDEAQPRTLSQWWNDRRNGVQWYTFWVAVLVLVLTVLFGLIQSVEGALQVYASFKSISSPG